MQKVLASLFLAAVALPAMAAALPAVAAVPAMAATHEALGFCASISAQVDFMCVPKIPIEDFTPDVILDCQVSYIEQYVASAEIQSRCEIVYAHPAGWLSPAFKPYRLRDRK